MSQSHSSLSKALCLVLMLLVAPAALAEAPRARLVVFGDSLSDPGNFYAAFGLTSVAPFAPVPSAPYAIGGHHFSNGRTWIEQLANELGTPESGRAALVNPGTFTNYAVGGARARPNAPGFPYFDLSTQVGLYLADFHGRAMPQSIYFVWFGGNDIRDALIAAETDPTFRTSGAILSAAIQSIADNVTTLWSVGARTIVVPNAPDLAVTPVVESLGPAAVAGAGQLSALFNQALALALAELAQLPGITLVRLDEHALIDAVVANPKAYGLENATTPCLRFGVTVDAVCEEPSDDLFWDGLHPTSAGHRIIAHAALHTLANQGLLLETDGR